MRENVFPIPESNERLTAATAIGATVSAMSLVMTPTLMLSATIIIGEVIHLMAVSTSQHLSQDHLLKLASTQQTAPARSIDRIVAKAEGLAEVVDVAHHTAEAGCTLVVLEALT